MKTKLPVIVALCALFVLIFASGQVIGSAAYGLRLCWELILPSLFPFFVVSTLLGKLGFAPMAGRRLAPLARRLFRVSGAGATALLVGLTGGYPLGAAYLEQLERDGQVPTNEAGRLLGFCNNSGPVPRAGGAGNGSAAAVPEFRASGGKQVACCAAALLRRFRGGGAAGRAGGAERLRICGLLHSVHGASGQLRLPARGG